MALRLTKTSLSTPEPTDPFEAAVSLHHAENGVVQRFVSRAAEALQANDFAKYRSLFEEASDLPNPHRVYQTRKLLIEQGLSLLSVSSDKRATEILLTVGHGALDALDAEPSEPVLLNYAGVVLHELWALDGARSLFQAAQRLDPDLPHIDRNLKGVAERARSGNHKKLAFHPAIAALDKRAKRVAHRAKPAEHMRLSLCMIVRDEEEMLQRTLEAIDDAVDEMIIVDTGSQDRTIEIAKSFGATVIEHEWTGSFSDARNVSLDAATGDWFIYLDADEVLVTDDAAKLRALLGQTWREAFYLHETNLSGTEEAGSAVVHAALRVFRNRPEYRFSGRIHEQIAMHLPAYLPERLVQSPVRVTHYGYLGVVRDAKDKARRNLDLLLAEKAETPAHSLNAFFHYNLGSEHFAVGDVESALTEYLTALDKVEAEGLSAHEYVPSLTVRTVKALHRAGRTEQALSRAAAGLEFFPGFTDLVYEQGLISISQGRVEEGIKYMEQAISMGDAPSKYTAMVGAGSYLPRIALAIVHMDRRETGEALELLRWCMQNNPAYLGVIHPYATALMQSGLGPEEVVDDVTRESGGLTTAARFMLGTALFERGHAAQAEPQFVKVLEKQPHSSAARSALVESLMYQRRYTEAAEAAQAVPEDDPLAAVVVRSELFGRLLAGDVDGAEATLAKAPSLGLPGSDQALYATWIAHARGDQSGSATLESVPLLGLMLEALLRVQDFTNFEVVLNLFMTAPLPERDRRELLAQMYLRRGFLRSAGREWMAVCKENPDARALVGLAQVALANGQPETAEAFAAQASTMEPANEFVTRLLARARNAAAQTSGSASTAA